jgi:hypothetical protein
MTTPDASVLLSMLLFEPGMVTRFPLPAAPQPECRVMCPCGQTPRFGDGGNLTTITCYHRLYTSAEFSGHVWIGRCPKCGKVFYAARRDAGLLPNKPLVIHRHKIVTK